MSGSAPVEVDAPPPLMLDLARELLRCSDVEMTEAELHHYATHDTGFKRAILASLCKMRFGLDALPLWFVERMEAAGTHALLDAMDRAITAEGIDGLLPELDRFRGRPDPVLRAISRVA